MSVRPTSRRTPERAAAKPAWPTWERRAIHPTKHPHGGRRSPVRAADGLRGRAASGRALRRDGRPWRRPDIAPTQARGHRTRAVGLIDQRRGAWLVGDAHDLTQLLRAQRPRGVGPPVALRFERVRAPRPSADHGRAFTGRALASPDHVHTVAAMKHILLTSRRCRRWPNVATAMPLASKLAS